MLSQDAPGSSHSSFLICSSSSVFSTGVFQGADMSLSSSKEFPFHWVREVRRWGRQEVEATGTPELGRPAAFSGSMSQELRWTPVSSWFSWQPEKPGISPEAWESWTLGTYRLVGLCTPVFVCSFIYIYIYIGWVFIRPDWPFRNREGVQIKAEVCREKGEEGSFGYLRTKFLF